MGAGKGIRRRAARAAVEETRLREVDLGCLRGLADRLREEGASPGDVLRSFSEELTRTVKPGMRALALNNVRRHVYTGDSGEVVRVMLDTSKILVRWNNAYEEEMDVNDEVKLFEVVPVVVEVPDVERVNF